MRPTELFTFGELPSVVFRSPQTLYRWRASGQLTPWAYSASGEPLYADSDVFAVERAARNATGGRPAKSTS